MPTKSLVMTKFIACLWQVKILHTSSIRFLKNLKILINFFLGARAFYIPQTQQIHINKNEEWQAQRQQCCFAKTDEIISRQSHTTRQHRHTVLRHFHRPTRAIYTTFNTNVNNQKLKPKKVDTITLCGEWDRENRKIQLSKFVQKGPPKTACSVSNPLFKPMFFYSMLSITDSMFGPYVQQ